MSWDFFLPRNVMNWDSLTLFYGVSIENFVVQLYQYMPPFRNCLENYWIIVSFEQNIWTFVSSIC